MLGEGSWAAAGRGSQGLAESLGFPEGQCPANSHLTAGRRAQASSGTVTVRGNALALKPQLTARAVENRSRLWGEDGKRLVELETREIRTALIAQSPCPRHCAKYSTPPLQSLQQTQEV